MTSGFKVAGLATAIALSLAIACSSSEPPSSPAPAGGSAGASSSGAGGKATGGAGGGGGGMPVSTGPAISSAPPAWVRPAECGGIGNLCPNLSGCAAQSSCQLEGNVCIPSFDPAKGLASLSHETPYCAAYTCMTFDQASCFCTGEAGKTVPNCSSPSALAGLCAGPGGNCGKTPCCDGTSCVANGHGGQQCQVTCGSNADCKDSGCCADPNEAGVMICSPKAACDNPCKKRTDSNCTPNTLSAATNCCNGDCIQSQNPAYSGCRRLCNSNADCDTGCCEPFSNGGGFCVDAQFCSCGAAGAACGSNSPDCCKGTVCAGDDQAGTCLARCNSKADCASQCCSTLTGTDISACLDPAIYTCNHQ